MNGEIAPAGPIQSVDRALRMLNVIASSAEPLSGSEVAERAGINRSTAWKLLATLEEHRLVERDRAGRYLVGVGVLTLAAKVPWSSLAIRARPILELLSSATGEAAIVAAVTSNGIVGIAQVDGPNALGVRWTGVSVPLTSSSPGKLLLASLSDDVLEATLSAPIPARTPKTLTNPVDVRQEIDEVRRRGVATSIGDHDVGVNGISAPVFDADDQLVATMSVTGPDVRLSVERIRQIEPLVRDAAARLAESMRSPLVSPPPAG